MRLLKSLIYACVTALVTAISQEDPIILFGPHSQQRSGSKPPSLSPSAARLLLARRLGLDQYHSLRDVGEATINALTSHGSSWPDLLQEPQGTHVDRHLQQTLIYIDGWLPPTGVSAPPTSKRPGANVVLQICSRKSRHPLPSPILQTPIPAGISLKISWSKASIP